MDYNDLVKAANAHLADLQTLRRDLHQIPEFGLNLPNTLARVLRDVEGLGEVTLGKTHDGEPFTAASVLIRGDKPGPTVLLRADMDALAVTEDTGEPFSSTNGYMHACGHDLHMAIGVGAAKLIAANKDKLAGNVVMFFQPGEEGHGGADIMLEQDMHMTSGDKPISAYGIHVFSGGDNGVFESRKGTMMAAAGDMIVTLTGKGGHGSMPWNAKDPISGMVEILSSLQTFVTKHFDALDPIVINPGWLRAGNTDTTNIVPATASFGATVRSFSPAGYAATRELVPGFIHNMAAAFGLEATVEFSASTRVLQNDGAAIERVERLTKSIFGEDRYLEMDAPIPGGEDMASILLEMPGAFVFLSAAVSEIPENERQANHSNKARFDDSVVGDGAVLLAALAFDHLSA